MLLAIRLCVVDIHLVPFSVSGRFYMKLHQTDLYKSCEDRLSEFRIVAQSLVTTSSPAPELRNT
jgi:hypothetical protein